MKSTALTLLLTTLPLGAQEFSAEFSPNPPQIGQNITITLTAIVPVQLPSPCTWLTIHQGSQTGPVVGPNGFCTSVIVPVAAGTSFPLVWDQRDGNNSQVPAGDYWVQMRAWDAGFNTLHTHWFSFRIVQTGDPTLAAAAPLTRGQTTALSISAPQSPGAPYFVAWAFDSDNPATVFGLQTALSLPIFMDFLSVPIGGLNAAGNATLSVAVPNIPAIQHLGAQMQCALLGGTGWQLTNPLSFTVR